MFLSFILHMNAAKGWELCVLHVYGKNNKNVEHRVPYIKLVWMKFYRLDIYDKKQLTEASTVFYNSLNY
jgi:hypothetical protein